MWLEATTRVIHKIDRPLVKILKTIAMGILAFMMFLTAGDVFLRYIFNRPITGAYEIIEYLMAILVSFSVTYCAYEKAHITVDIFIEPLSKRIRILINLIAACISFIFFLFITWQTFKYILDEIQSNLTSSVLLIPVYPFIATVAVAFVILCIVLLVQILSHASEVGKKWTP